VESNKELSNKVHKKSIDKNFQNFNELSKIEHVQNEVTNFIGLKLLENLHVKYRPVGKFIGGWQARS
jgi:hypothetical protein